MFKKLSLLFLLFLGSCSYRFAEFGVLSPEVSNLTPQQLSRAQIKKRVTGQDSRNIYFIFPAGQPTLDTAVRNALEKNEADILINVKADYKTQWYIFYGHNTIEVSGDAIKLAPMIEGNFFHE